MPAGHLELGRTGEKIAAKYLKNQGYKILERNWRGKRGELDMVCSLKDTIVFVEVKTRREHSLASPHDALTGQKKGRLVKAASEYLSKRKYWDRPCRFDLIAVTTPVNEKNKHSLEHVENAFEFPEAAGQGRGAWQPW